MTSIRILLVCLFISSFTFSQSLVINEISQGTAAKEYVEFVVVGNSTCQTPVPTIDLRGIVLDDNNGSFAPGSGTGIAVGAVRFANITFWSAIPQGTIILVYNEADINPAIPPNDISISDGNCRLIIPINSSLFEGQGISPMAGNTTYPTSSAWFAGSGLWAQIAMSNTNDSFQIRQNNTSASATHSVSWGNNNLNNQIYFATATGAVFSMMNTTNNNHLTQANWTNGAVGTNETPGAANSPANDAWIGSMNPQCGVSNTIQLTLSSTPTACSGTCSGTANVLISGGAAPYTIAWSNGMNTANINGLCAGTYTVIVTDNAGCSETDQVTISNGTAGLNVQLNPTIESCFGACNGIITSLVTGGTGTINFLWNGGENTTSLVGLCAGTYTLTVNDQNGCTGNASVTLGSGNPIGDASITSAGPFSTNDNPINLQAVTSGGTWTSDCGTCINSNSGLFDPETAGEGTFQICYSIGTGVCVANDCASIIVSQGCSTIQTSDNISLCPGFTYTNNGTVLTSAGAYPNTFIAQNGCDSIFTLNLFYFPQTIDETTLPLCEGDSVFINGNWIFQSDFIQISLLDNNGCAYSKKINVVSEDCSIEPFNVFVPNAFTPSGDGINDTFEINISGGKLKEGFILNRWGNIIKEFSESDLKWDGKTKQGILVQDGVYTYVLRVENSSEIPKMIHGFVTVFK